MLNGGQSDPGNKETATPWQLFELNITNNKATVCKETVPPGNCVHQIICKDN